MTATLLLALIVATFVTVVLIPPLVRGAEWLRAYDLPSGRKIHVTPIPRLGGVAMVTGAILPLVLWAPMTSQMVAVLCGIGVILAFGVWDDIRTLGYGLKFLGQIIAALLVILLGDVVIRSVPFSGIELPDVIAIPLTLVVLVGVTNAVNLADGLDGLAGGITLLSLAMIGILAYPVGSPAVLLPTAAVIGSIVGFLRFNTYPARIFMGDSGSQFLGFSAGVMAVVLTQQSNPSLSPALPLLLLGLPILDTAMVIGERLWEGRSPFQPDKNHLHHKLLTLGFHHFEAVFAVYVLQASLLGAAYILRFEADWLIVCVYGVFCIALIGALKLGIASRWRVHDARPQSRHAPFTPRWLQWLREGKRVLKGSIYFIGVAIPGYLVLAASLVERVPEDVWVLSCGLLALAFALYLRRRGQPFDVFERACAYIACASVVYLVYLAPGELAAFNLYRNVLFAAMAIAVATGVRLSRERFSLTPTDFLVVLLALAVPNLPTFGDGPAPVGNPGVAVAMLVILFYGVELVLNNIWRRWDVMRFTVIVTLSVLALRGMPALD